MHPTYRNIFRSRIAAAVAAARAVDGIVHDGMRGDSREVLLKDLFRPLLPPNVGAATGEIISHTGLTSTQQDVVLYDRSIIPPVLFEERIGQFPIESVLYSIEVKSKLSATELRKSHAAASELQKMDLAPGYIDERGVATTQDVVRPICTVFAYDTDLSIDGKGEDIRYMEMIERDGEVTELSPPPIAAICVVGRGYWYWEEAQWRCFDGNEAFDEIMGFIVGVMNTYKSIIQLRGSPRFGRYLY